MLPVSLLIPRYTQNVHNRQVLMALIESGGTISFIHKHVLLTEVASSISTNQIFTSLAGEFHSDRQVLLQVTVLLEFIHTACVESHTCQVLIGPCSYDNILGWDFLQKVHFHINIENNTVNCMDMSVPMQSTGYISDCAHLHSIIHFDNVEVVSIVSEGENGYHDKGEVYSWFA